MDLILAVISFKSAQACPGSSLRANISIENNYYHCSNKQFYLLPVRDHNTYNLTEKLRQCTARHVFLSVILYITA